MKQKLYSRQNYDQIKFTNACQNSGDYLLPSHIQSKKLDSEKDTRNYNFTCCYMAVKLGVSHSKGRTHLENVRGQNPEKERLLGG
jgi:hypothetical protein